jgi:N-glycosylase/DNA lyase
MENQIKEKLDNHDQLFDQLISAVEELQKKDYPDYKTVTEIIKQAMRDLKDQVAALNSLVTTLLAMKHTHIVDFKTKRAMAVIVICGVFTCLSVGLNFSQYADNHTLKTNSLKYRMIRQATPEQTDWADSAYLADPDGVEKMTKQMEEESEASSHAADLATQKEREAKKAQDNAKALRNKSAQARKAALSGDKKPIKN